MSTKSLGLSSHDAIVPRLPMKRKRINIIEDEHQFSSAPPEHEASGSTILGKTLETNDDGLYVGEEAQFDDDDDLERLDGGEIGASTTTRSKSTVARRTSELDKHDRPDLMTAVGLALLGANRSASGMKRWRRSLRTPKRASVTMARQRQWREVETAVEAVASSKDQEVPMIIRPEGSEESGVSFNFAWSPPRDPTDRSVLSGALYSTRQVASKIAASIQQWSISATELLPFCFEGVNHSRLPTWNKDVSAFAQSFPPLCDDINKPLFEIAFAEHKRWTEQRAFRPCLNIDFGALQRQATLGVLTNITLPPGVERIMTELNVMVPNVDGAIGNANHSLQVVGFRNNDALLGVWLFLAHPSMGIYARGNASNWVFGGGYILDVVINWIADELLLAPVARERSFLFALDAWPRGMASEVAIRREMLFLRSQELQGSHTLAMADLPPCIRDYLARRNFDYTQVKDSVGRTVLAVALSQDRKREAAARNDEDRQRMIAKRKISRQSRSDIVRGVQLQVRRERSRKSSTRSLSVSPIESLTRDVSESRENDTAARLAKGKVTRAENAAAGGNPVGIKIRCWEGHLDLVAVTNPQEDPEHSGLLGKTIGQFMSSDLGDRVKLSAVKGQVKDTTRELSWCETHGLVCLLPVRRVRDDGVSLTDRMTADNSHVILTQRAPCPACKEAISGDGTGCRVIAGWTSIRIGRPDRAKWLPQQEDMNVPDLVRRVEPCPLAAPWGEYVGRRTAGRMVDREASALEAVPYPRSLQYAESVCDTSAYDIVRTAVTQKHKVRDARRGWES